MATCISLFSDAIWQALVMPEAQVKKPSVTYTLTAREWRDSRVCRWCVGCPLDGLCDSDECGRRPESDYQFFEKLYRDESPFLGRAHFPNLGELVRSLKAMGLDDKAPSSVDDYCNSPC